VLQEPTEHHVEEEDITQAAGNIRAVVELEREALARRSRAERLSDAIIRALGSSAFLIVHVLWFAFWLLAGIGRIPGLQPFDPFPFAFLTMVVSLEAIFLAIFVLISQNRMARLADHRAHLDLQVNLLAEQEITTTLQLVQEIRAHLGIGVTHCELDLHRLLEPTDVQQLSTDLAEQLPKEE
jgi:uncharacterized membrane protein